MARMYGSEGKPNGRKQRKRLRTARTKIHRGNGNGRAFNHHSPRRG